MPNFDPIAAPLDNKLRKGHLQAFHELSDDKSTRLEMVKMTFVEHPYWHCHVRKPTTLWTQMLAKSRVDVSFADATRGIDKPMGYWSRVLNDVKCVYDSTHREGLNVLWAVLLLQAYLEGF